MPDAFLTRYDPRRVELAPNVLSQRGVAAIERRKISRKDAKAQRSDITGETFFVRIFVFSL